MIKLCIFDLDGTLLDTVKTIAYYGNYALEKNGLPTAPIKEYNYFAGCGIKNLIINMLKYSNSYTESNYEKVYNDYSTKYDNDVVGITTIFDGLKEVLDSLKNRGIILTVISNKPDFATKKVIETLYGKDYFNFVTGQKDGVPLKPNPTSVLSLIDDLNVSKEECVYIGDTMIDMQTANNANIKSIGVTWGFRDEKELNDNGATYIVNTPQELFDLIVNIK